MVEEKTVFWFALAILYLILAIQNFRWLRRIRNLEQKEGSSMFLKPDGIAISKNPETNWLKVTDMFYSILKTDTLALVIGLAAAVYSLLTV
jgi:hypothetical protein